MGTSREAKEVDLGSDSVGKLLLNLAIPIITAQIINALYNMVDRMCIDRLPGMGANAPTGVDVTFPVIMAILVFVALVSMGGASGASTTLGKGKKGEAENILGDCITALIVVAVVLTAFSLTFGCGIPLMFGVNVSTIEYGWAHMQIYSLGTIFVQLALGLNVFINAQGYAKTGMFIILIGAVCNIIPDPIPMFRLHMGARGAALAAIIFQGISAAQVALFLLSKKSYLNIYPHYMKSKVEVLISAIALGAAPFVMQFTESILSICFNTSLLEYGGDVVVGAMTIMGSMMQFSLFPLQGLTQGAQSIISFNFGVKKLDRVSRTFRLLLISCTCYSTAMWAVSMFAPLVFIRIFTKDPALTAFSTWSAHIYMVVILLFGAQLACRQTFIAPGDNETSLFLALLRKVILPIPLIYVLSVFFENKVFAAFLAEPIADTLTICTTVPLFIIFFRRLKREMK